MERQERRTRIEYLSGFVTERRLARFHEVLNQRTRYITVALEDIYQPHNASAVLRSCDGFGVQDAYIIENRNSYTVNPGVELGTRQWLTLHRFSGEEYNTSRAITRLRSSGYRIVATTPHTGDVPLEEFDLTAGPAAFFFGNELDGLSETMLEEADEYMRIPMYGFVESFNISVSCALTLHHLSHRLRGSDLPWRLSGKEREELLLQWLRSSIKRVDEIEKARFSSSPEE
jgi:tRNA (guanosine-2'-O-)-methyltransferase